MENLIQLYAELTLKKGVNLQKDQVLVIESPVIAADFTAVLTESAMKMGAKDVVVHFSDYRIDRARLQHCSDETLRDIQRWQVEMHTVYGDSNACFLRIDSNVPGGLEGVSSDKLTIWKDAVAKSLKALRYKRMSNDLAWSCVAVPNHFWAKKVFPELSETDAMDALWKAVFDCCYVSAESATAGWDRHVETMQKQVAKLNALELRTLHFRNKKGTDLTLELCQDAVFAGGICHCPEPDGIVFAPNIPTEEILSTPHRNKVNGIVYNTLPLCYNGTIVDDFSLEFKDGVVTACQCAQGEEILKGILEADSGSNRLGEVALVPYNSPINQLGRLFYDTLFDENASCHLALGAGYTDVILGEDRSEAAFVKKGLNTSALHVDFMFGSEDMSCVGVTKENKEVVIFENGLFVL